MLAIDNLSRWFGVDVPESSIAQFKQGDLVTIRLDTIKQVINGTVDRVIPTTTSIQLYFSQFSINL